MATKRAHTMDQVLSRVSDTLAVGRVCNVWSTSGRAEAVRVLFDVPKESMKTYHAVLQSLLSEEIPDLVINIGKKYLMYKGALVTSEILILEHPSDPGLLPEAVGRFQEAWGRGLVAAGVSIAATTTASGVPVETEPEEVSVPFSSPPEDYFGSKVLARISDDRPKKAR